MDSARLVCVCVVRRSCFQKVHPGTIDYQVFSALLLIAYGLFVALKDMSPETNNFLIFIVDYLNLIRLMLIVQVLLLHQRCLFAGSPLLLIISRQLI